MVVKISYSCRCRARLSVHMARSSLTSKGVMNTMLPAVCNTKRRSLKQQAQTVYKRWMECLGLKSVTRCHASWRSAGGVYKKSSLHLTWFTTSVNTFLINSKLKSYLTHFVLLRIRIILPWQWRSRTRSSSPACSLSETPSTRRRGRKWSN